MRMRHLQLWGVVYLTFGGLTACSDDPLPSTNNGPALEVRYDYSEQRLNVTVHPSLEEGEALYVRVRNGQSGVLNCSTMFQEMPRIDGDRVASAEGHTFLGPPVNETLFQPNYDIRWLELDEPTPEMLTQLDASLYTVDICVMKGDEVSRNAELDIRRALDRRGSGKFDGYGDADEVIASTVAYGQACINNLGEIPFFEKIAENDYATYSCLDSVPIPMTVTSADGQVTYPEVKSDTCDNPQFIYSSCEPNAVTGRTNGPRVTSAINDQGTHWVLLCRKAKSEEGQYDDVAMIGHNPYTGQTCYFQNALYRKTDGVHVPHPADDVESTNSPQKSLSLWNGIHGGYGNGIECAKCHDSDPFIHTPWIDQAKDENGDPIIPMLGIDDGFTQGFNEAPYSIIDTAGQGWRMPKSLANPEAAPCTKCHRIGSGRWARSWLRRMEGEDDFWNRLLTDQGKKFENVYWMPSEMAHLDAVTWPDSEYGKALDFIQSCVTGSQEDVNEACDWRDLPTEQILEVGELPEITLEGRELARESLKILGAAVSDPNDPRCTGENASCASRRCAECHSVSEGGLRHWSQLTKTALDDCKLREDPATMSQSDALASVQCLRARAEDPNSVFAADKLGIFTTGVRYGQFRSLFRKAYGEQEWLRQYIQFKGRVGMPKGTYSALSQQEYAVVLKWFRGNLTNIKDVIEDIPAPSSCVPYLDSGAMDKHIEDMSFDGWGAVNRESGVRMFGCETDDPSSCFGVGYPDRTADWGTSEGSLKELVHLQFRTSFWTRSSADGRFVANGGGAQGGATVTDLLQSRDIKVKASYDPGFFPDNSGFIFQGGGTGICPQSVLESGEDIDFEEPGCIRGTNINLYQHVARGLNGGDYFVINSQFTSDSGRNRTTANPVAHFGSGSTMKFSPMIFNGTSYEQQSAVIVDSPFEGDSVLSPSGRLVISRLAGGESGDSLGYVIREVITNKVGDRYEINIDKVMARICIPGAKANISFDERFFVTHQYEQDRSIIVMVDLKTGQQYTVTNMPPNTKALFPHFRSDNWLYILVREGDSEYVIASDLAIRIAERTP